MNRAGDSSAELWRWTGTDLARGIRTRRISSREAVESCLARIAQVNPHLNALVEVSPDEALAMADAADRAVAAGATLGPLHGVPVAIKVNSDQAGHATTNGMVALKDAVATVDSPQVQKLRAAGAVFVARSNTPAFSLRWFTDNALHGRTLNPWDAGRTPGGSSGGASAAVASGMVPIAHGNDIGGSIRYPAFACGVVGVRPTLGRVPGGPGVARLDRRLGPQTMAVQGPLARSVGDLRLALDALSGFDPRDPFVVPLPLASTNAPLPRPLRVGLLRDAGVVTPQPSVNDALDTAARYLADAGYIVEEVSLPLLAEAYRLWYLLVLEEMRQSLPFIETHGDEGIKRAIVSYYAVSGEWWGERPDPEAYMGGYARRGTLIGQLQTFMEECPLLLLPVSAESAFEQDADLGGVDRARSLLAAQWPMMSIATLGFPGLAVPTGVANGLPTGVQLVGRRFREDTLFDAAEVIEARCGTLTPIEPVVV
jgi:amidase